MKSLTPAEELDLQTLQKIYDDMVIATDDEPTYILVPKKIKTNIYDKIWKKLPWYAKLEINIKRIFKGNGLYKLSL